MNCLMCNRRAKFRLDAYETGDFPTNGQNLACPEHLAQIVMELEEQLSLLDDSDCLCVSVLDEPTTAERSARTWRQSVRQPLPGPLTKSVTANKFR